MLNVTNLHFDYLDKPLLQRVHFSLKSGELLHLRGKNGVGKTTLLKLLAGILTPLQGDIWYQNQSILKNTTTYCQQICFVGHKPGISQSLTVRENNRFELKRTRQVELSSMINQLSLQGLEDTCCSFLSAGQRRRVALMRLALTDASLWLLDEPFTALDPEGVAFVSEQIRRHLDSGGQVVMTSHSNLPEILSPHQDYVL